MGPGKAELFAPAPAVLLLGGVTHLPLLKRLGVHGDEEGGG